MASAGAGSEAHLARILETAKRARQAGLLLAKSSNSARSSALTALSERLNTTEHKDALLAANKKDTDAAIQNKLSSALANRLDLSAKLDTVLHGVRDIAAGPDPLGKRSLHKELANGLNLQRVTTPIGVLCIIFESRPDAALQIGSLCIKSGNAVLLKGGKEAAASNAAIVDAFRASLESQGLPADAVQLVSSREDVSALLAMDEYIDLVIPRGSKSLVRHIQANTRIPVLGHADGICSVYLHEDTASLPQDAVHALIIDAKTQYAAACNAAETLLLHPKTLEDGTWAGTAAALAAKGITMLCDPVSLQVAQAAGVPQAAPSQDGSTTRTAGGVEAAPADAYDTEYLGWTLAVKVVPGGVEEAVAHINEHGSGHTDCILTQVVEAADAFKAGVASASAFVNASTRFADGQRYGFGAELGISTGRIHARGPVGLEGMVTYKYLLDSTSNDGSAALSWVGQFSGEAARKYTHVDKQI
jgi:glutamate-5-semialdehyde dehydrogenase